MDDQSQNNQEFQKLIQEFISGVIQKIKLTHMTPDEEEEMRGLILEKIDRRILAMVIDDLTDDQFEEFMGQLEERQLTPVEEEMLFSKAVEQIPDFPAKFISALSALEEELLQDAEQLRTLMAQPDSDSASSQEETA